MLSAEVYQGNLYSRSLFGELALTGKNICRACFEMTCLSLAIVVCGVLPTCILLRDHKNEH